MGFLGLQYDIVADKFTVLQASILPSGLEGLNFVCYSPYLSRVLALSLESGLLMIECFYLCHIVWHGVLWSRHAPF